MIFIAGLGLGGLQYMDYIGVTKGQFPPINEKQIQEHEA